MSEFFGPVSWWPAEGNTIDSADGNHGTLLGNATYTPGEVCRGFAFDGNRDGVSLGTAANLQLQDFSIEGWVKRTSASLASFNGNGNGSLFMMGAGGGGYGFWIQQSDSRLTIGKLQVNQVTSGAQVIDTNWHHVAVTKSGTTVIFYLDGVAYAAPPYDSGGYTFAGPGCIGGWLNPSGLVDNTFYGAIDELAVYNRILSGAEVQAIYNAGNGGKCAPSSCNLRVLQEFTNTVPPIITLTNAIPYFNTNSAAGNATDYYRFVVSTNAVRAQFEINNPSGDMTLAVRKGLPLPNQFLFDYISTNPSTNDELIVVFTNSTPVPLSAGDWYLSAINVSGGPVSYSIKATEWPVTGQPIAITNSSVVTNSFCLTWTSLPGVHYYVEALTSLSSTNWVTVSPTITATGYSTTWCLPLPSPFHFFRVVEGLALSTFVPPAPIAITSITRTNNALLLQWTGSTNAAYQVQWTPTLSPVAWTTVPGTVTSPNGQFQFLDDGTQTGGQGPTRFYRLLKL